MQEKGEMAFATAIIDSFLTYLSKCWDDEFSALRRDKNANINRLKDVAQWEKLSGRDGDVDAAIPIVLFDGIKKNIENINLEKA